MFSLQQSVDFALFACSFDVEEEFKLKTESHYHHVDGEEGDKQVKGYFHNEKLWGVWINYGGDHEESVLTEYGKSFVIDWAKNNIERILKEKISCIINEDEFKQAATVIDEIMECLFEDRGIG